MTQVLGQPLSDLPLWSKLPVDIIMQIVQMKTKPEEINRLKQQQSDIELWDTMFPELKT